MKKVLIADDEKAGRTLIKEYLQDFPDLVLIAEVNNGVDAITEINRFKPDLVFLDIQMPGKTGFEVLTYLEEIPSVIFSTAYDEFALKAFEVHAVDYLLKPYTKERFKQAIERLSENKLDSLHHSGLAYVAWIAPAGFTIPRIAGSGTLATRALVRSKSVKLPPRAAM